MRALIDEDVHVKVISWLITRDADFSDRFLYPPAQFKGIIVLKIHPPKLEKLLKALKQLLDEFPEHNFSGKLIILEEDGCRLLT